MARPMRRRQLRSSDLSHVRVFGCRRIRQVCGSPCGDGAQVERASRRLQVFEAELQIMRASDMPKVKEMEIQTEGAGEVLSQEAGGGMLSWICGKVAVDERELADFLRQVGPVMEQELQLAWRSL